MIIRCKKTKRFLCELKIEEYLENLEKIGIVQELPIKLIIPCRICKKKEVYNIYKTHYVFLENLKK